MSNHCATMTSMERVAILFRNLVGFTSTLIYDIPPSYPPALLVLPEQRQFPVSPRRIWQRVERSKSKSTQPSKDRDVMHYRIMWQIARKASLVLPDEQPVILGATPNERPRVAVAARLVHAAVTIEGVEEGAGEAVQNL